MNSIPLLLRARRRGTLAILIILSASGLGSPDAVAAPPARVAPVAMLPGEPTRFVRRYLDAEAHATPATEGRFFAPQVDYYTHGKVSRAFVLRDQQEYRRRWPVRRYRLDGPPEEVAIAAGGSVTVRYHLIYEASNAAKVLSGITIGEMRLQRLPDGSFVISALKETAL